MAKEITISSITGSQPFNIYVCTNTYTNCTWYSTINNTSLPYSFLVPKQYENFTSIGIKVVDNTNCEIKSIVIL